MRRLVPAAGALELAAHDYDHDPGKPACAWDDAEARDRLVSALVTDALAVLGEIQDGDLDAIQTEAVGLLGLVAGQDVEPGQVEGRWRIAGKVAADRVISTVDLTPGTCTRAAAATATATRRIWPWNPRPGW